MKMDKAMDKGEIRALIVDDLKAARDDIREHIDALGHASDEADCVEEARKMLKNHAYNYVVLDLQLPMRAGKPDKIEYGKAFLDEIIGAYLYMGIVVVTGHGKTYLHVVDVMGRSPLVRYVPKPFDDDPRNPKLTDMIRIVLEKVHQYRSDGLLPCAQSKAACGCAIGTIDVRVIRRKKNSQVFCLVNGTEQPFSYREHAILVLYAQGQSKHEDAQERYKVELNSDLFGIEDEDNMVIALSRLRKKIEKYLPEGHPKLLENFSYRCYYLGCYCIDSTE